MNAAEKKRFDNLDPKSNESSKNSNDKNIATDATTYSNFVKHQHKSSFLK